MEAIYETAGRGGEEGEQHPTSLEEEMPFLPPAGRRMQFLHGEREEDPFVALYFAECPVRVTDKGLCEGKMQAQ